MPRQAKGARIYQRPDTQIWIIRDGSRQRSTGTTSLRQAEGELARYIAERDRPAGPSDPSAITVADVLLHYAEERAATLKDARRVGYALDALLPFFGPLKVSNVTGEVCRRYAKARGASPGTVRTELQKLQAAINHCHAEGYLTYPVKVKQPVKPAPRERWLTRDEVAKLLRAARNGHRSKHLVRFILAAVYTGTRSKALLALGFMPNTLGGWVDCERGIMYRRGEGEIATKKRKPPIPIPRQLLAHLRRWERNGARWVVEYEGERVGTLGRAFNSAVRSAGIERCTPHDLRRTAITWAMQNGIAKWDACGYFGITMDLIESTYGHHHPDHLAGALHAMERRA